jgi:hypothetical protein
VCLEDAKGEKEAPGVEEDDKGAEDLKPLCKGQTTLSLGGWWWLLLRWLWGFL